MLAMFRLATPVLVSVVFFPVGLVPPTVAAPRLRLAGTSFTVPAVIVMVAEADLVVSFTETALSVAFGLAGTEAAAVYVVAAPLAVLEGEAVPQPGEHAAESCASAQVTPTLDGSKLTVALNV